jgi:hypothetical protein
MDPDGSMEVYKPARIERVLGMDPDGSMEVYKPARIVPYAMESPGRFQQMS